MTICFKCWQYQAQDEDFPNSTYWSILLNLGMALSHILLFPTNSIFVFDFNSYLFKIFFLSLLLRFLK